MKPDEYQCENCKGIFKKGWSDEEAKAEADDFFKDIPCAVVCDDCYKEIVGEH